MISNLNGSLKNSHFAILSKSDEETPRDRLSHVIPTHENFHFMMCIADIEAELFRDCSRGLDGGAFTTATLLNRKRAKLSKGKDDIDSIKDFINIKAEAMFAQCFLSKYKLDPSVDNTPPLLRTASKDRKIEYLHSMVADTLRDLIPYFKECSGVVPHMKDFPFITHSREGTISAQSNSTEDTSSLATANLTPQDLMSTGQQDGNESGKIFVCYSCQFITSLQTIMNAHVRECAKNIVVSPSDALTETSASLPEEEEDFFWNYKSGEFFIDSIFKLMLNFERYGNGLGIYIISKVLLPYLHSLRHSNYSNSIHRFVCRVLTMSTPREGLLLIWERFCNRSGREDGNIFKDTVPSKL